MIDGNYDTSAAEMASYEKEYQAYHSLMNFFNLHILLASGLPMPIIDTDERRVKRADFAHHFAQRRFSFIRAKTPQIIFDEVERLL